jgi:hypothetical protein
MTYHSPKYWKEMKSLRRKLQAPSAKPKPEPSSGSEVSSNKLQAASHKLQASSRK